MCYIEEILDIFILSGSSDLHISVGKIPMIRYQGYMIYITDEKLKKFTTFLVPRSVTLEDIDMFMQVHQNLKQLEYENMKNLRCFSIDSSMSYKSRRFRLHLYQSSSGIVIVFRILQETIPTIDDLCLPNEINILSNFTKGLVIVTGATGSGKSTTLAAILNQLNMEKQRAIVTVEDPIEYVYEENKCRIEQREVGVHVDSFSSATRDMMREDPDIILVGEMRDIETIRNTITLSETGHLVFATLHTKSVSDSIDRIIDVFPPEQQQQVRVQLSYVLLAVLNQTLIKGIDRMIPICEMLVVNSVTSSLIRQGKNSSAMRDYMRSSKNGSFHLVDNIAWHIKNNRITLDMCHDILSSADLDVLQNILNINENNKYPNIKRGVITGGSRRF